MIVMEQIEYTRTVVPSSMRSPYWKYFGFPSDNGNNILTRQKVVCTLCNNAIAYNKNTSNLRTHLMSKHVEIFQEIVLQSNTTCAQKQTTSSSTSTIDHADKRSEISPGAISPTDYDNVTDLNRIGDAKRSRIEEHNTDEIGHLQNKNNSAETFITLPKYTESFKSECSIINTQNSLNTPTTKEELDVQSTDYITFLATNDSEIITDSAPEVIGATNMDDEKFMKKYAHIDGPQVEHEKQRHSIDLMLADMIQTDLLPLDILEERGFCKYNHQLTGLEFDDNTVNRIIKIIEERFENIKQITTSHVSRLSQSQPYSLSFEIYKDNEEQEILNIYCNYLSDNQMDLKNVLYTSCTICNREANITELLMDINLKNCSGVVVTCLDDPFEFVSDFTKSYDLPLIECLESVLTRCLQKIFELNEFRIDYEKVVKCFMENNTNVKRCNFRSRCKWNRLNFLEFVFQNAKENGGDQWNELRRSFEYLKPLKMAMDIINDEPLPLSSLTRPLVKKLFEEHFSSEIQHDLRICQIQKILEKELNERIMTNHFYNEVAFFDVRFHRDFALQEPVFDIGNLKTAICKRFKHILEETYVNKPTDMIGQNETNCFMNTRKCSSLMTLFKRDVSYANANITNIADMKTNLDLEIEQYQILAHLELDQSPVLWWVHQSDTFKELAKIAKHYLTIPCCCLPRLCRIDSEQRYSKLDRRKHLSQFNATESKLWYLYYNDAVTELL